MSSTTPRKKRAHQPNSSISHPHSHQSTAQQTHGQGQGYGHQRTRSQHLAAQSISANQVTSDYESDTASYMASHPGLPIAALAQRTNTDLNMSVLKRYLPNITEIRSIAAQTVVYTLDSVSLTWDKANVEGTMFVCQQGGQDTLGCIFILNRKATDNLILDLRDVKEIEPKDELLIFAMADKEGDDGAPKVLGLFIHADEETTRATNIQLIQELWGKVREARMDPRQSGGQAQLQGGGVGLAMQAMGGRHVSLDELFGR